MSLTKARLQSLTRVALTSRLQPLGFERVAYGASRTKVALWRTRSWGHQMVTWEALGRPTSGLSITIGFGVRARALEDCIAPFAGECGPQDSMRPTLLWALSHVLSTAGRETATDEAAGEHLAKVTAEETFEHGLPTLDAFDRGQAPLTELEAIFLGDIRRPFQEFHAALYRVVLAAWLDRPDRQQIVERQNAIIDQQCETPNLALRTIMSRHRDNYRALLATLR